MGTVKNINDNNNKGIRFSAWLDGKGDPLGTLQPTEFWP